MLGLLDPSSGCFRNNSFPHSQNSTQALLFWSFLQVPGTAQPARFYSSLSSTPNRAPGLIYIQLPLRPEAVVEENFGVSWEREGSCVQVPHKLWSPEATGVEASFSTSSVDALLLLVTGFLPQPSFHKTNWCTLYILEIRLLILWRQEPCYSTIHLLAVPSLPGMIHTHVLGWTELLDNGWI